ncbi:MAG TPA: ATP-binding protein [Solirubrobacteraceae bacterium]
MSPGGVTIRLRTRFALLAASLVLLVASVVGVVGYLTLRHSVLAHAARTAQTEAARLVGLIGSSSDAQGDSLDITDSALTSQLSTPGLRVEVDRASGRLIQSTRTHSRARTRVTLPPAFRRRCLTHGSALERQASPAAQVACRRVGPAAAPLGTVAVAAPLQDSLESLSALGNAVLIAVVGGTALAALLSLALARRALRPVRTMALTAERIRRGDLTRRVDYRGRDELGELARVLDACFDQLEEGIERQRRFGADASHELKTPLSAIRANVELLRSWGGNDPAAREAALASLDQSSRRASRLVADLLQLAKLDREPPVTRTPVPLDEVVLRAVREAQALRAQVAIRVSRLDEATVQGDPVALEQLLLNLLDNALAASPVAGEVEVSLSAGAGDAKVTVSDGGPGIPADELDRVFERFFSKRAGTGARASAGLGLAIAREIARGHDGDLRARNRPTGGAVFELTVPLELRAPAMVRRREA